MISLPIISIIFCLAYIIFIVLRYGVPVSLSETYYILPNKLDWMFAAWTALTALPFSIYWFITAPTGLKWIPVTVAIAVLMIGVASCYKSGPKKEYSDYYTKYIACGDNKLGSLREIIRELKWKFSKENFFKYGPARIIHYVNSLITIGLITAYIIIYAGIPAIVSVIISYTVFIIIGLRLGGIYNEDYSADIDNKTWIFFMEIVCLINLFVFIW